MFKEALKKLIQKVGPAVIAIGFSLGTGSVTTMVVAGSKFGADLLWVNFFACLFSWACVEAYDRFYLATGETALMGIKKYVPNGKLIAWMIIIGISYGQYNALMGNLTTTANAIFETFNLIFPALRGHAYAIVVGIAIINVVVMTTILNMGKYQLFEKILACFVIIMSFCFILSIFIKPPSMVAVAKGFIPQVPTGDDSWRLIVAIVGTTMASATFITRPLFLQANQWTKSDRKLQANDAILANLGLFVIGTAILMIAMSTLYAEGKIITKVLDMVGSLEPIAGRFALFIFLTGTLSAGVTAIFPILMITPMMLSDLKHGKFEMGTRQFKWLTILSACIGLLGPLIGKNPIDVQVFSQVFLVLILPVVVLVAFMLVNNKKIMGDLKAGSVLNLFLIGAFIFSVMVSYFGAKDIIETLVKWFH